MKKVILVLVLFCGCNDAGPQPQVIQPTIISSNQSSTMGTGRIGNRFNVTISAQFEDEKAYGSRRQIYIIYDKATEKEYIGISGVGISEVGQHGKAQIDER